jgi:SAM-dependent methyltransferase
MGSADLHAQYEALPYPPRNPEDERKRLITGSPSYLDELDHYGFGGLFRNRNKPVRCLIAGGGTGDATIMLAQQLRDAEIDAEIHHVDLSAASCAVAEARASIRDLTSIRIRNESFLTMSGTETDRFDYIDCCGVLHHLDDPLGGLRHLVTLLKPDGALGLMVYGQYGRTGLYPIQGLLRELTANEDAAASVAIAKRLIKALPETNWLRRNPFLQDHLNSGDSGIYDLLLCAQDRASDVMEVNHLVTAAGLRVAAFIEPAAYDPSSYVTDANILRRLSTLTWVRRCAAAERLSGAMRKHVFYCVSATSSIRPPDAHDDTAVPVLRNLEPGAFADSFRPGQALTARMDGIQIRRALPPLTAAMVRRIDGSTPVGAIIDDVRDSLSGKARDKVGTEWRSLYETLNSIGKLYLRGQPRQS